MSTKYFKVIIEVSNNAHSAKAQRVLFKLGYVWLGGSSSISTGRDKKYLYINTTSNRITHGAQMHHDVNSSSYAYRYIGKYIDLRWLRKQLEMAETLYELEK